MPPCRALSTYTAVQKRLVPCACCAANSTTLAFTGDRYNFGLQTVVCDTCGLVFTSPRPVKAWFEEFYRKKYRRYYECVETPDEAYLQQDWVRGRHQRNVDLLTHWIGDTGALLDIGCAEGTFLSLFESAFPGWTHEGVEPSESFSQFARTHYSLANVKTCGIDDLEQWGERQFDLITASHVLEHLLEPDCFFATARRLLKENGLLFIDVPDSEGSCHGIENLHIGHVYHFSQRTLQNFLDKNGFDVLLCEKGKESSPWTFQCISRKRTTAPADWSPPTVNSRQIAREFARYCKAPRGFRRSAKTVVRRLAQTFTPTSTHANATRT